MKFWQILICCGCFWVQLVNADELAKSPIDISFAVEKYQLKNGLTVLLHKDDSVPLVSLQQWYRVGSTHEEPGKTGLAHFFEHLMFKGTPRYPGETTQALIQKSGGSNNAFTTFDYTGYYVNFPPEKLQLFLDMESDRMVHLRFDQKEIDAEREVVKEEKRVRFDNSVYGSMFLAMVQTLFKVSDYRWPVIGSMRDLNAASIEDFKSFYHRFYSPNNSVLVLAGSFDVDQAKKYIDQYYGKLEPKELNKHRPTQEPSQMSPRHVTLKKDVQAPSFSISAHAPHEGTKDSLVMDIIAKALGEGDSSRLHRRLVYKSKLATYAISYHYPMAREGLVSIVASLSPGKSIAKAMTLVKDEIAKIRKSGLTDLELEKTKNIVMVDYVNGLKTISGKARAIAETETVEGDYSLLFDKLNVYQSITKEDVIRVANQYLTPNKFSIIKVMPK